MTTRTAADVSRRSIVAALLAILSPVALAAPPLSTDDAATLDPGACQLEIERRRFSGRTEWDVVPGCNLIGDAEVAVGKLRVAANGEPRRDSVVFQVKKVLIASEAGAWSAGASVASVRASGGSSHTRQNAVTGLFTQQFGDNVMHLNVGVVDDREAMDGLRKRRVTWGAAVERDVTERWTILAEAFGQQDQPELVQAGFRWWAVPKQVQFIGSFGAQRGQGKEGRWIGVGIRLETGRPIF